MVRLDFLLLVESLIQQLLDGCINEALERFRILMGVRKSCLGDARQALAPLDHLQNVLLADVRDLVSHHGSQFSFVPNLYQEPTRDEDVPSRRGKGIDRVVIEYGETIGNVWPVAGAGDSPADQIDVPRFVWLVGHPAIASHDLQSNGLADG